MKHSNVTFGGEQPLTVSCTPSVSQPGKHVVRVGTLSPHERVHVKLFKMQQNIFTKIFGSKAKAILENRYDATAGGVLEITLVLHQGQYQIEVVRSSRPPWTDSFTV